MVWLGLALHCRFAFYLVFSGLRRLLTVPCRAVSLSAGRLLPALLLIIIIPPSILSPLLVCPDLYADTPPTRPGDAPNETKRAEYLWKRSADLYHTLKEKKAPGFARELIERVTFGGLIEVEGFTDDNDRYGDTADIVLATLELGFDVDLSRFVKGHLLFLWEEDRTEPMEVDVCYGNVKYFVS